jgi:hypothetical protein
MFRRSKATFQATAFVAVSVLTACHSGTAIPPDSNAALPQANVPAQTRGHHVGMTQIGPRFYLQMPPEPAGSTFPRDRANIPFACARSNLTLCVIPHARVYLDVP